VWLGSKCLLCTVQKVSGVVVFVLSASSRVVSGRGVA